MQLPACPTPGVAVSKRYEVQCLLGEGGMGAVYRARDRLSGQLVALKRVAADRVSALADDSAAVVERPEPRVGASTISGPRALRIALAQEFRTLAALRHPNIVSVLDYGFDDQHLPFFTMEYLERPASLIGASQGLPLAEQLDLVAQLLRALTYLHRHAILHRDL
jgi:eukaryotic-like serine/threonine-protein kinase